MKKKFLRFCVSLVLGTGGLTAGAQSWSLAGNVITSSNYLGSDNNQPLVFKVNNIERMRIIKAGFLGIGTTAPNAVLGVVTFTEDDAIRAFTSVSNGNGIIAQCDAGSANFGVWGIADNSSPTSAAGFFSGNLTYTGTLSAASDQKLKENIKPVETMLDRVMQLKPSLYNYKNSFSRMNLARGNQIGFVAQDLEKVFPQLVTNNVYKNPSNGKISEEYKGINYLGLIPVLTKAIQEQQQEIEELKQMVQKLSEAQSITKNTIISGAKLEQNTPNPFTNTTTIRYNIPTSVKNAQLTITDNTGKTIKQITLSAGTGIVNIDASMFESGTYNYTLILNNKSIESKKMIVAH